jgi:hypothetical protein
MYSHRTRGTVEIQCREASKCNPFSSSSSDETPEQPILFVGLILYKKGGTKKVGAADTARIESTQ